MVWATILYRGTYARQQRTNSNVTDIFRGRRHRACYLPVGDDERINEQTDGRADRKKVARADGRKGLKSAQMRLCLRGGT